MIDLFKTYECNSIENFISSDIKYIITILNNIIKLLYHFNFIHNTDIVLKFLSIISYPNIFLIFFDEYYKLEKTPEDDIFSIFKIDKSTIGYDDSYLKILINIIFIDITEFISFNGLIDTLKNKIEKKIDNKIDNKIQIDTQRLKYYIIEIFKYQQNNKQYIDTNKYILTYSIILYIYENCENINNYILSQQSLKTESINNIFFNDLKGIIIKLFINLLNIKQLYDKLILSINTNIINDIYKLLLNSNKNVYTLVRIRNDNINPLLILDNPRYLIQNYKSSDNFDDKNLEIVYKNTDMKFDFPPDKNVENNYIELRKEFENQFNKYNTSDEKNEEEYDIGHFDYIFSAKEYNNQIETKIRKFYDEILFKRENKNLFIIGYGQSGSGKTSTLIYLNTKKISLSENQKKVL